MAWNRFAVKETVHTFTGKTMLRCQLALYHNFQAKLIIYTTDKFERYQEKERIVEYCQITMNQSVCGKLHVMAGELEERHTILLTS